MRMYTALKDKNSKKIDKLKSTFQTILTTKLGEIENEAIGQIREAKLKEEQAMKNLKEDHLSIHEHEKIVNEKIDYCKKQKKIELTTLSEKYEQEMRHLKETFTLKASAAKEKNKNRVKELLEKIEFLRKFIG